MDLKGFWQKLKRGTATSPPKEKELLSKYQLAREEGKNKADGRTPNKKQTSKNNGLSPTPTKDNKARNSNSRVVSIITKGGGVLKAFLPKGSNLPSALETSLIKEEVTEFFDWQSRWPFLGVVALVSIIILGGVYGLIALKERREMSSLQDINQQIEALNKQIQSRQKDVDTVKAFQEKLKIASSLLDRHIFWSNFFVFLEQYLLEDVYLTSFSGNVDGEYTFQLLGKPYFYIPSEQVKLLRQSPYVQEVKLLRVGKSGDSQDQESEGGGEISFEIYLKIDPEKVFYQPALIP